MLALIVGTLAVTAFGSLVLVRRAAQSTAQQQLYTQARSVAGIIDRNKRGASLVFRDQAVVKLLGQYRSLSVVGLSATGAFSSPLPDELQGRLLEPTRSWTGRPWPAALVASPTCSSRCT